MRAQSPHPGSCQGILGPQRPRAELLDGLRDTPLSSEATSLQRAFSQQPGCRELCLHPMAASFAGWLFRAPLGKGPWVLGTGLATGASHSAPSCRDHPHPRHPPVSLPYPSWPGHPLALWHLGGSRGRHGQAHSSPTAEPSPHPRGLSLPKQERLRQLHPPGSAPGLSPGGGSRDEARARVQPQWARTMQRRQGHALQRRLLEHKLLTAVSPWVGEVDLLCARPKPAMWPRRGTARGPRGRGRGLRGGGEERGRGTCRHTDGGCTCPARRVEGRGPCTRCRPAGVVSVPRPVLLSTWQPAQEGARGSPWHSQCAGARGGEGIHSRGRESGAQVRPSACPQDPRPLSGRGQRPLACWLLAGSMLFTCPCPLS